MATKFVCDRCGSIIDTQFARFNNSFRTLDESFASDVRLIDLCLDCYEDFEKFMANLVVHANNKEG